MSDLPEGDSLLSDFCTICHTNTPKYRCPRCSTRTCSLPCSRRHKLWSQCSGVRDPAAYLRRNELATPAAFDRDFNFITGIERSVERAERDAENRGIPIDHQHEEGEGSAGQKRKRPNNDGPGSGAGLVKGEAGFLRGAQNGEVRVIRAPKGMSRNNLNNSRWHPKQKCLIWTVEWISPDGEKRIRTCLESCRVAEAYDRFYPLPKQERRKDQDQDQEPGQKQEPQNEQAPEPEPTKANPEQEPNETTPIETQPEPTPSTNDTDIIPHRDVYFYLHRPRTATKKPVLNPLAPGMTFTSALRTRTVLEFPTVYVLPDSPGSLSGAADKEDAQFLLEEYLQAEEPGEEDRESTGQMEGEDAYAYAQGIENQSGHAEVDLGQVDEKKVLEVLSQDLFEPVPAAALSQ